MQWPKDLIGLIRNCVETHASVDEASECAVSQVTAHASYSQEWQAALALAHIRTLVYQERGNINGNIKANPRPLASSNGQAEAGGATAIVNHATANAACQRAYESVMDLMYGGKRLRSMTGEDLRRFAENEKGISHGHLSNACLFQELAKRVAIDQRVEDVLSEDDVIAMQERAKRKATRMLREKRKRRVAAVA